MPKGLVGRGMFTRVLPFLLQQLTGLDATEELAACQDLAEACGPCGIEARRVNMRPKGNRSTENFRCSQSSDGLGIRAEHGQIEAEQSFRILQMGTGGLDGRHTVEVEAGLSRSVAR